MDFILRGEERHLVEIKGGTLEENGICWFPRRPHRAGGARHLEELAQAVSGGIFRPGPALWFR